MWLKVDSKCPKPFSNTRVDRAIETPAVPWTAVLKAKDPRSSSLVMLETKRDEFVSLIRKGTFRLVILPEKYKENVIPTKVVLALKHATTEEIKHKARFVLGRQRDRFKSSMVHTASTITHAVVRLLLVIAAAFNLMFGLKIFNKHFCNRPQIFSGRFSLRLICWS